jgi:ABC-type antimicrobial peptide transport system permease subunit
MKAVGWDSGKVARLITLESALQAFMGGFLGCALGYLVAFVYAATVEMNLPHGLVPYSCVPAAAPPSNLAVAMRVSPTLVAGALGLALVLGVLSGFIGACHAARLEPAEALRRV